MARAPKIKKLDWYRYRSFSSDPKMANEPEEILLENKFYFPVAASMDDAAEGRPRPIQVDGNPPLSTWVGRVRQFASHTSEAEIQQEAADIYRQMGDERERRNALQRAENRMIDLYNYGCPICSFAPDVTCMRYWGQYAGKGAGYAVRTNFRVPWLLSLEGGDVPVRVRPSRVRYSASRVRPFFKVTLGLPGAKENNDEIRDALFRKSRLWKDQRESRIVRLNMAPGHVEFPAAFVDALYLGYSIDHENRKRLLNICRRRTTAIDVYQCAPSPTHYAIDQTFVGRFGGPSA